MSEKSELPAPEAETVADEIQIEVVTPIIVELGSIKPRLVKKLKKGRGRLMEEVVEVLDELAMTLEEDLDGKTLVPIIMVYESKKKKKKRRRIVLPF